MRKSYLLGSIGIILMLAGAITFIFFNNPETIEYNGKNYEKVLYKRTNKNLINDSINYVNMARKTEDYPSKDNEAIIIPVKDEDYIEGYTFVIKYIKERKVYYAFNGLTKDNYFILLSNIQNIEDIDYNTEKSNYDEAIKKYMYKKLAKKDYNESVSLIDLYKNNKDLSIYINNEEYKVVKVLEEK